MSPDRIVLTSNDSVQLRCRSTGAKLSGTNTIPLRGADLASGLFVTDPATDNLPSVARSIFDPRVIYDGYSNRFWIVASENGADSQEPQGVYEVGRIHIAVSKTSAPSNWTGTHWIKCTFGAGADKSPIDIQSLGADYEHTFPDRCSLAVDKDYLYICFREGRAVQDPNAELFSVILVVPKASVTGQGQITPIAVLRIDQGLAAHALAVDYSIDPNAAPGVYVISRGPNSGGLYTGIRLGTVSLVNGNWTYSATNYAFTNSNYQYLNVCASAPGGLYTQNGQDLLDTNYTTSQFWSCVTRPYHNGARKIWAVHAVRASDATESDCQARLQWYEIGLNPVTVTPTRYALSDGDWAHDPSMAVNGNGDLVISFNRSYANTSKYPGVWRLTLPWGGSLALSEEKAGPSVVYRGWVRGVHQGQPSPFWADFTGTEPDPVDDCQFWSHQLVVYDNGAGPKGVSEQWQSHLYRYRVGCQGLAFRGNLDMNQDGDLTADDIAIYTELAVEGDPKMDRTYDGETDVRDYLDFMNEWDNPE